jgi:hypothetical protein
MITHLDFVASLLNRSIGSNDLHFNLIMMEVFLSIQLAKVCGDNPQQTF